MTTDPTTTDHDNGRAWATRVPAEWKRPYFGDDAADAVAAATRAVDAANAAETTPTQPTGRDDDHARESAIADVLTEHRYLCQSDRGVSPRWEECACGERFTTTPDVPAWRLLAEHQAARIARSAS